MTTAAQHRQAQVAYVAELFVIAFHAGRGIHDLGFQPSHARQTAVSGGARIRMTDEAGSDLDSVQQIATATLLGQDFRVEAVALFLDDLVHDAANLAREQREDLRV